MELSPKPTQETTAQKIASFLRMQQICKEKSPFFIGRLSGNESLLCGLFLKKRSIPIQLIHNMLFGAGIQFLSEEDARDYANVYTQSFQNCDLIGVWNGGGMYEQSITLYETLRGIYSKFQPICATGIEPFYYMHLPEYDFCNVFQNKKVLILSSHSETIKMQLPIVDKICQRSIFHASTTFYIHKPPQQNGGSHDTQSWKVHFESLKKDVKYIREEVFDFDIALVGCGGFGMPICDYIYTDLNRSVIYLGGALQLCFGIMGRRWKTSEEINKHVNKYWVSPLTVDIPENKDYCEGGCYW